MSVHERDWFRGGRKDEPEHAPVCGNCGEDWPCRHERIERKARAFARDLEDMCHHCGRPIGLTMHEQFGGPALDGSGVVGPKFHTAKSRFPTCATAAKHYRAKWQKRADEMRRRREDGRMP